MRNSSVDRSVAVLHLVASSRKPLRFIEMAPVTGVPKGTPHALISRLEHAAWLERIPDGCRIGGGAFEVESARSATTNVRKAAATALDESAQDTREACTPVQFRTAVDWNATRRMGLNEWTVAAPLAEGPEWFQRLVDGDPAAKFRLTPDPVAHGVPVPRRAAANS